MILNFLVQRCFLPNKALDLKLSRCAESWWCCSDSDSDSGLLIDSDSGSDSDSDSGLDTNYKINNTLIVERVFAVQAKQKKRDLSY